MIEPKEVLNINTKTWGRDSHGLFDFEAIKLKENSIIVDSDCILTRQVNDIKKRANNSLLEYEEKKLCDVIFKDSK